MSTKRLIHRSRFFSIFVPAVVSALLLASCALPGFAPAATKTPAAPIPPSTTPLSPLIVNPTDAPIPFTPIPRDTATATPSGETTQDTPVVNTANTPVAADTPIVIQPSPTTQIFPTSAAPTGSIAFAPGTTAGVVAGTVQAGQVLTYTLGAEQSQSMILSIVSTNLDVTLGVIQPDGGILVDPDKKWTRLQWPLPMTGLYKILVVGGATVENFTLTAKVPQRVSFAAGTSSITLNGTTVNGALFSYALNCQANQTMTVNLTTAPANGATLDIFGIATGSLLGASAKATSGSVVLPQTQDYVIEVIPNGGQVVAYSLTVTVTSPTSGTAENIVFDQGTTAGVKQGTIKPGEVRTYTISAGENVPMVVIVDSQNYDVTLGVFEPNGNVLAAPYHKWTRWQGLLPKTEVYTIQVIAGATVEDYSLTVKLPVRLNFALGTGSVTVNGTNTNGYVFSYVIRANGGQDMTVSLNVDSTKAYLDVFGLNTGVLLSPGDKASSWTGTLPIYQDYIVEVVPRGGYLTSYTLTISVH